MKKLDINRNDDCVSKKEILVIEMLTEIKVKGINCQPLPTKNGYTFVCCDEDLSKTGMNLLFHEEEILAIARIKEIK